MIASMESSEFEEIKPKMSFVKRFFRYLSILLFLFIGTIVVLLLVALFRAISIKPVFRVDDVVNGNFTFSESRLEYMTSLFAESLRFKTISQAPHNYDREELLKMHDFLKQRFVMVFRSRFVEWQTVNNYSLLLTIKGQDPNLSPYLLAAHLDVVPVQADQWDFDPFLGRVIQDPKTNEEVVWGRGAIDDKSRVMGILSALELLLESGWMPRRGFYIAFGHDEEVMGLDGAAHIAKLLEDEKVKLEFILDEGMPMTTGIVPGVDLPLAVIGVTEKGFMNVQLVAKGEGGHSSIPPTDQAVDRLSKAISNLYNNPQPSMYGTGPEVDMLRYMAYDASWPHKLIFSNEWLFKPLINLAYSRSRTSNVIIRTTTAVTLYKGGIKVNVIPTRVSAVVNHRVHPGQTLQDVIQHDINAIADDKIEVTKLQGLEPHPISHYGSDTPAFRLLASVLKHVVPDVVIAPGLMVGNTDCKHYFNLTDIMYRFFPFILDEDGVSLFHAKNERLSVTNFIQVIKFFLFFIKNADSFNVYEDWSTASPSNEL